MQKPHITEDIVMSEMNEHEIAQDELSGHQLTKRLQDIAWRIKHHKRILPLDEAALTQKSNKTRSSVNSRLQHMDARSINSQN